VNRYNIDIQKVRHLHYTPEDDYKTLEMKIAECYRRMRENNRSPAYGAPFPGLEAVEK
jgi:hypothetical protein